jgi:hypothetical protein
LRHLAVVAAGVPAENAHALVVALPHRSRNAVIVACEACGEASLAKAGTFLLPVLQAAGLRLPSRIMRPVVAGNRLA